MKLGSLVRGRRAPGGRVGVESEVGPCGPDTLHDLCRPEFCPDAAVEVPQGEVAEAVRGLLSRVEFREGEPRSVMGTLATRLAESADRKVTPAVSRELRVLLSQMTEDPNHPPGAVDEIRLAMHRRRVEALLPPTG